MVRHASRVDLVSLESETIADSLSAIAAYLEVPPAQIDRLLREPGVSRFLELLSASLTVTDMTSRGHTRERAVATAAAELGMPVETLRSITKRARGRAFGGLNIGSNLNLPPERDAA